jgi:hypothetical protein
MKILSPDTYLHLWLYTYSGNNDRKGVGIERLILVAAGIIYKMLYYKGNKRDNVVDSRNFKTGRTKNG